MSEDATTDAVADGTTPAVDIARLRRQFDLSGRIAFVPGGYGALGEAICWALALHGAAVVVAGPDGDRAGRQAEAIRAEGLAAEGVALDARDVAAIRDTVETAAARHGGLDILVNCVGIQREQTLLEVTPEAFDTVYEVNLRAAMFLGQAVGRVQVAAGRGGRHLHLLSVRSQLALRGRGYSAYCATKGGLLMLVRQHAMELAPHGITVNGVAPTFIRSDRIRRHMEKPAFRDFVLQRNPLGRIGDPVEVAGPVVALVSDAGSYVTGQVLYVDGGVTASQ